MTVLAAVIGVLVAAVGPAAATPTVPTPGGTVLVFVPHADDDVLSMGIFIHQAVEDGKDVRVVYYTDGAGTGLCSVDASGICRANDQFHDWDVAQFIAARDSELEHSVEALGVPADHIDKYAPDGQPRRRDGTSDVPFAEQMLRHYHDEYPTATYLTMSWLDGHTDHRSAGAALRELVREGVIPRNQALFTLARWYWAYAYPDRSLGLTRMAQQLRVTSGYPLANELLRCADVGDCLDAVRRAVLAYKSPADGGTGYGIGYASVREYLDVTENDPEVLLHGYDSGRYAALATFMGVGRWPNATATATVRGVLKVPSFGRYDMNPDNPANAADLAQTVIGTLVAQPLPPGTPVVITSLGAGGAVLSRATVPMSGSGTFAGALPIPAAAIRVSASTPASQGVLPATVSWPVAAQQVTAQARRGVEVSRLRVNGGYGRRVTVAVRAALGGVPRAGVAVRITGSAAGGLPERVLVARTGQDGIARFTLALDRPRSWRVVSAAPTTSSVAALGTTVTTQVTPAALVVRPARSRLLLHGGTGVLRGAVVGRDYNLAPSYLLPVTVRVWLTRPHHAARLVATVVTALGGAFSVVAHVPVSGTLVYDVAGRAGVFTRNRTAATAAVTVG